MNAIQPSIWRRTQASKPRSAADTLGRVLVAATAFSIMLTGACDMVGDPQFIEGLAPTSSEVPELTIIQPRTNTSISQGQGLQIEWSDFDRDSNATVAFFLVDINNPDNVIRLVDGIQEDPDGASDRITVSTSFVTRGAYNLRGTIDDGINRPVTAVAFNQAGGLGEVVVQIVEEGTTAATNLPPRVFVRDPMFNQSVSQDDTLSIVVQPMREDPNLNPQPGQVLVDTPFDPDSTATLYVLLDLDNDPLNDNVVAPDPNQIILLAEPTDVALGDNQQIAFPIAVDLETIPIRPAGEPYFIRATITDGLNAPVHAYAAGTINVVRAATGSVDLAQIGKTISGALFRGFNPGAFLGTRMVSINDFDADGIDDCMLVAQFGNPRNFGNAGEAYLIYGQDSVRFGGEINVNSTARTIQGVIFEGAPTRCLNEGCMVREPTFAAGLKSIPNPRTDGITDVSVIPDLDGDNRPDIIFAQAHVDGVFQGRDDDPDDNPPEGDETIAIQITMHQGNDGLQVTIENEDEPVQSYFGVQDAVISSAEPDRNFRAADLEWVNRGAGDATYSLVKFTNVLSAFPPGDTPDRISDIGGNIAFTVLDAGGNATVHECFTNFTDSAVTFNNFSAAGGEPIAGIDYDDEELGNINADEVAGVSTINIDELLNRLLINDLPQNEIRLIIVPADAGDEDAGDNGRMASSEFLDVRQRPELTFNYEREILGGPFGCYADPYPNNFSDMGNLDNGQNEDKGEANGFVVIMHSSNRDNDGIINPNRLADTVVPLELIGQRVGNVLNTVIESGADNDEDGKVDGARIQAGWYDYLDHLLLDQPPLNALFGQTVSWIEDINLDNVPEIVISAPNNEMDIIDTALNFGNQSTHLAARVYTGSIIVIPGDNYDDDAWRDMSGENGTCSLPAPEDQTPVFMNCEQSGTCDPQNPIPRCGPFVSTDFFEVFAEDPADFLGGATSAGDFNLDSVPDLLAGAPLNDRSGELLDTGAMYVIYGRSPIGNFDLSLADDPRRRPPMLRMRGETPDDRIGWKQQSVQDVNGDRIDDVMFSSPHADFIIPPPDCGAANNGVFNAADFDACRTEGRDGEVFVDDFCKQFDYNNDRRVDNTDRIAFDCLIAGGGTSCCPVDNGYVGIIFGGINRNGDRIISQVGTTDLPGVVFFGTNAGDRAGHDISSAGDFDQDGFGDFLISAPGEFRVDDNQRVRMGVTYLVYGGPHLEEQEAPIDLSEIGDRIPGIVFLSPYVTGAPDEAPPEHVGVLGDLNNDGFTDIAIGNPRADLQDPQFPQGEGTGPALGRSPDQGDIYVIYGNNINR